MDTNQKENDFIIQNGKLSPAALKRKTELENNPASRTDHMAYLPDMEQISSDIRDKVLAAMNAYEPDKYTARDVLAALSHDRCSIEDFKALLSPAAEPFLEKWHSAPSVKRVTTSVILPTFSHRCILQITVKITVFTAVLTAITIFTENSFPWKKLSMK